ncbi:hypothetical protein EVJ58_g7922 [Rhodofomes roseus]|uniref:Uncharacterized protein n=1 Tax=Rhodofomes roseus TaxID=34475 RepID=A0A4Y9Y2Y9_9APHY|nr:hypothetical protein EVJ58_g7922 [Rhodofomes roseus]
MPIQDTGSDDYFAWFSDDDALVAAANQLDPPQALVAPKPFIDHQDVHRYATPARTLVDIEAVLAASTPASEDAVRDLDDEPESNPRTLVYPDMPDDVTKSAVAEALGLVAGTPDGEHSASTILNLSHLSNLSTPAVSSPSMTPGLLPEVAQSALRPLVLASLRNAQVFGESGNDAVWWLDGMPLGDFTVVVQVKQWDYTAGSIHAIVYDDTHSCVAIWDDHTQLPALTEVGPRRGDLVILTARLGFSPEAVLIGDAAADHWQHLVVLAVKLWRPARERSLIAADLVSYAELVDHYDCSVMHEADSLRLEAIRSFVPENPGQPIPDFMWSIDRDIKHAIQGLDADAASTKAIKISIMYRLTRRAKFFVRLSEIVRDISSALLGAGIFNPEVVNSAIAQLISCRTLFQFELLGCITYRLSNPHLLVADPPPIRRDEEFSSERSEDLEGGRDDVYGL